VVRDGYAYHILGVNVVLCCMAFILILQSLQSYLFVKKNNTLKLRHHNTYYVKVINPLQKGTPVDLWTTISKNILYPTI